MKIKNLIFSVIAATILIAGIGNKNAQANDNNVLGIIIGGAAGGFLGSNVGKGRGQLAATAVGTLLGAAIGNDFGNNTYQAPRHRTVYNPTPRPRYQPVYQPQSQPRYQPTYAPAPRTKVVIHKVTVKHVYVSPKQNKRHKRRKFEKRRRQMEKFCYKHPRKCERSY